MNSPSESANVAPYEPLRSVLMEALAQAAHGKGAERHANNQPFLDQPMMQLARMVGPGFPVGQAMKKAQEAIGMAKRGEREAAAFELIGAMNYLAGAVLAIREERR